MTICSTYFVQLARVFFFYNGAVEPESHQTWVCPSIKYRIQDLPHVGLQSLADSLCYACRNIVFVGLGNIFYGAVN